MKTKNNLTTGILIGISVIVLPLILMSSSTSSNNGIVYGTPESHVWEFGGFDNDFFMWNKKTGEVRKVNGNSWDGGKDMFEYKTMEEGERYVQDRQ